MRLSSQGQLSASLELRYCPTLTAPVSIDLHLTVPSLPHHLTFLAITSWDRGILCAAAVLFTSSSESAIAKQLAQVLGKLLIFQYQPQSVRCRSTIFPRHLIGEVTVYSFEPRHEHAGYDP